MKILILIAVQFISKPREEPICRICRLNSEKAREKLISPCSCKGTLAYIHRTCLEKWLKRSGTTYCELCRFNYTIKVVERYINNTISLLIIPYNT